MTILRVFLPVIWALVACGIALLLYRTATALVIHEDTMTTPTRERRTKLSLGGSVVIGVIAFVGMLLGTRDTRALTSANQDQIQACRDTFLRVSATLSNEDLVEARVRASLDQYLLTCKPVIEALDGPR